MCVIYRAAVTTDSSTRHKTDLFSHRGLLAPAPPARKGERLYSKIKMYPSITRGSEVVYNIVRPATFYMRRNHQAHPGAHGTRTGTVTTLHFPDGDARHVRFAGSRQHDKARVDSITPESRPARGSRHRALSSFSWGARVNGAPGVPRLRSQRLGPAARGTAGKHQGCSVSVANNKTILTWAA